MALNETGVSVPPVQDFRAFEELHTGAFLMVCISGLLIFAEVQAWNPVESAVD